jgi:hypothetical protein
MIWRRKSAFCEGSPRQLLEKLDKVALEYNIDIKSKHGQRYPILWQEDSNQYYPISEKGLVLMQLLAELLLLVIIRIRIHPGIKYIRYLHHLQENFA